jgi:hypothetical protein
MKTITQIKAELTSLRAEHEEALLKLQAELKDARARSVYRPVELSLDMRLILKKAAAANLPTDDKQ